MEQDTVKVVKRTIGLVLILAAAMGIAGILLEFFGSPWGASGAQKAAQAYVEQTYPEQEFQVDKAAYSLSVHGYEARVEHAQKEDVFFTVTVKDGQIVSDSYQADVREKGNTVRRLEEDYAQMVQQRLEEADLSVSVRAAVHLERTSLEQVQLGMAFSLEDTLKPQDTNFLFMGYSWRRMVQQSRWHRWRRLRSRAEIWRGFCSWQWKKMRKAASMFL